MDLQLKGRTALVTGASAGIGRGTALSLAAEGAQVALLARRMPLLEEVAAEIVRSGGPKPLLIAADVTLPDAPAQIRDKVLSAFGKLEIIVHTVRVVHAQSPLTRRMTYGMKPCQSTLRRFAG
jgi:3-oxoacyl-[acyl-carrier protein] reductase